VFVQSATLYLPRTPRLKRYQKYSRNQGENTDGRSPGS